MSRKKVTASRGNAWLKKSVLATLAGVLVGGGALPALGVQKAHAGAEKVIQVVAGTGTPGHTRASKAALSQLNAPKDIDLIEMQGASGLHMLLFNNTGDQEAWMAIGNGLAIYPSMSGKDYTPIRLKNGDQNVSLQNVAVSKGSNSSSSLGNNLIYFTGSSTGDPYPTVFALANDQPSSPDASGTVEYQITQALSSDQVRNPAGLATDAIGNVYALDEWDNMASGYRITPSSTGNTPPTVTEATYLSAKGLSVDLPIEDIAMWNKDYYILDGIGKIYAVDSTDGEVETLPVNSLKDPTALSVAQNGDIYVADTGNNRVVRLDADESYHMDRVAGLASGEAGMGAEGGYPLETALNAPEGVAVATDGTVYISDTGNHRVLQIATPQAAPTLVTGQAANGAVNLSWSEVPDTLYYEVYRYAGPNAPSDPSQWEFAGQTSFSGQPGAASFTATGLNNDQPYVFAVKAKGIRSTSAFAVSEIVTPVGETKYTYEQQQIDGVVWNLVKSAADLDHMRDDKTLNYKLTTDISKAALDAYLTETKESVYWRPIGGKEGFTGQFDGGGHSIEGLTVREEAGGLFSYLYKAKVENLRLTALDIVNYENTGGLSGTAYYSNISKVSAAGKIQGSGSVGGLVGDLQNTTIRQSFFDGSVSGSGKVGGLIGRAAFDSEYGASKIQNNYVWGKVSPLIYTRMNTNTFTTSNTDRDRFGGFVGTVAAFGFEGSTNASAIFENNYTSVELDGTIGDTSWMETFAFGGSNEGVPSVSNYWNTKSNTGKANDLIQAKPLEDTQMKERANFIDWDFEKIWMMDPVSGYPILGTVKEEPTTPPVTEPTTPTVPTIPSTPSTGSGEPSTPIVTAPTPSNTTTINVNVQNDKTTNGSVVSTLAITRTKGTDGTTKDALQLTPAKAAEIINLLKTSGSKTAAIVLPDTNDEVSQWDLTVPNAASKVLTAEGVELVILNPNVRITVPASSLTNLTDDLYFRLIPVKSTSTSAEIQARALATPEIVATANGGNITVLGRPMTIETNLQSRPVTLTLPLPAGSTFTAAQQRKLGVYIEHSDGTKQLVPGKVVTGEDGKPGLELTVNHFSTFTIVNVSSWGGTLNAAPYILGYQDGSFKPEQDITRAELAAIVGRITGMTTGTAAFSDVKNGSWASTVAGPAAASGIMTGYSDGTFKPNASITRAELAAALAKLLPQSGLNTSAAAAGFRDLAAGHWATEAAAQLQAAGVITGYADGSFKPEQAITRAEAVMMINRLIALDASTTQPGAGEWTDVASAHWAHDAILAASMKR
ncbi:S-layer homology domain-containing protein [Saccharibacillus brassicae]|uniref:SLH domain-containing protein n=1 Tax=Saccharibacillus brassicae TaxID=2583377 RepID=A0A4Y6UZK3_SACBS|nr:S-layer homology domain-containing protein [Saccharibacillus brassicae]QDH21958.1 hypothetical protein FFV09_14600 [Saccharibacillus brassicae]